jgi:hypothetical protein
MNVAHKVEYNERLEELIAEEGEKSLCYSWLHSRAEALYSHRNTYIALPVIVLSTLAGTASIGSDSLFGDSQYASVGIGLVSIAVGILNTVGQYFSWAKRSEGHRIAHITYQKLFKFISVELSLPRRERMDATDLLKVVREEVDRLCETSPMLPLNIIQEFQSRFKKYTDIARPEITNGLERIYIYEEEIDGQGKPVAKLKGSSTPKSTPIRASTLQKIMNSPSMNSMGSSLPSTPVGLESIMIQNPMLPTLPTLQVPKLPVIQESTPPSEEQ